VLVVSIFESLPKEKTALLGTAEMSLSPYLLQLDPVKMEFMANPISNENISVNLNYGSPAASTQKPPMTAASGTDTAVDPKLILSITTNKPLVDPTELAQSNVLEIGPTEVGPLPEEWNHKESAEAASCVSSNFNIFKRRMYFARTNL
jgi:hypothetical protein